MNNTQTVHSRVKFYVDRKSALVQASLIIMALSAAFRVIGFFVPGQSEFTVVTELILPIACNILFVLIVLLFPKRMFVSALPVVLGVVFFIIKSFGFESWVHTILCIVLYLVVAILYSATVFGVIRTKWLLAPLFGLPLLYHIFVEDLAALRDTANPVTFIDGMYEISVLCIMLSLLLAGLALKKDRPIEQANLPKIKDPVVIPPENRTEAAPAAAETAAAESAPAPEAAAPEAAASAPAPEAEAGQPRQTQGEEPAPQNTEAEGTDR